MITYNYFGKEQKVYYDKLENGLDVYIIPNKKLDKFHIEMVVKYGSEIEKVKLSDGKELTIPHGTAHFLEHKMFDMEEDDGISYFAKLGLYANAGTNYYSTRYFIDGNNHFKEGLDYLLNMIFTPYINDDTVKKEYGIIEQEIKMYDDEPFWIIDNYFRESFYQNILKYKISGTIDDIHQIDSYVLNKVYEIFYKPSNMFLVISGNVSYSKTIEIIKNNKKLNKHFSKEKISFEEKKETSNVVSEYRELKLNILIPKVRYAFKFDLNDFKYQDKNKLRYYLNLIFAFLFEDGSIFDEEIVEKKIATYYYLDHFRKDNIYTLDIEGESLYADLFKEEVDKTLENISINEADFERIKKIWYSIIIRSLDNPIVLADSIVTEILLNDKYVDEKDIIDSLKYSDLRNIIKELNFKNKTFMLILPKEEK